MDEPPSWDHQACDDSELCPDAQSINRACPALKPPPEVWKAIFELFVHDVRVTLHPSNDCISFSQVCRYLRNVTFMTPHLWTTQKLPEFNFRNYRSILSFRELFAQIIRLSQSSPLTFSINIVDSASSANQHLAQYCLKLLCEQSHRWKSAYVDTSVLAILPRHVLVGSLPLLEHIGVIGSSPGLGYSHPCIGLLESAPRLTSVECHDFGSRSERILHPSLLTLPHISHFSAGGSIEPFNVISVDFTFLRFTHLTSLDMWFPALDSAHLWMLPPVAEPESLALLTSLSLKFATMDWIIGISKRFPFPNITSLTISTGYSCDSDEFGPIIALYADRKMRLCHIGFSSNFLSHETFSTTIRGIPNLRSVSVFDICWDDSFFEWLETLTIPDTAEGDISTSYAFPKIQRLCLRTHQCAEVIEFRWRMLREQSPFQEPITTDGRFCSKFTFNSGMKVLQQIVAERWIRSTYLGCSSVDRLENLSVDYDCFYAMKEYAQGSCAFLNTCWADGLEGRPSLSVDWSTRELPTTWAGYDTVPQFFREECEDEANPWTYDVSDQYEEDRQESLDSFESVPAEGGDTPRSGDLNAFDSDGVSGHGGDAVSQTHSYGVSLEHDGGRVGGRDDGPSNSLEEELIVRVEGPHGTVSMWASLCVLFALLSVMTLMLLLIK